MVINRTYRLLLGVLVSLLLAQGPVALAQTTSQQTSNAHLRGVVVPATQINMSMSRAGLLSQVASAGSPVKAGDVIAAIDTTILKAELQQSIALKNAAQANLDAANHSLEKNRRLVKQNILSDIALTEAQFAVKTAQANLEVSRSKLALAQLALDAAVLKAPFDGVIVATKLSQGEWLNAGDPFVEFANIQVLTMAIDVPPELTQSLNPGDTTPVRLNNQVIGQAQVTRLFPMLQPSSGLRRVVWQVTSDNPLLLSGRYVELAPWF